MSKLKAWIISLRLRTLPLSISAILMGSILAGRNGYFSWEILIWASITTLFLQILSNLSNDYGDAISGADNETRLGPKRMIQSGVISKKEMKIAMIICTLAALISGIILLYISFRGIKLGTIVFVFLGLFAIISAVRYTVGKNPYGYRGFGDIFVFIFFGIIGVAGTFYLHGLFWNWNVLLPAATIGFFSTAVLNINNIRDFKSDQECGKKTIVVKIGRKAASWYHFSIILLGWSCFLIFTYISEITHILPFLTLPLFIIDVMIVLTKNNIAEIINGELRFLSISTLLFVILNIS